MMADDYNFYIYPNNNSYCKIIVNDLLNMKNVFFAKKNNNPILRKIQHIHTSLRLNKLFRIPLQSIWYPSYLSQRDGSGRKNIFVFFQGSSLGYDKKYLMYLKNKYPDCTFVFYWLNIAKTVDSKYVDLVNRCYDYIYTFDCNDAQQNNWRFYETMFSTINKNQLGNMNSCSDVCFVGNAKGRLNELHMAYESLTKLGLKCDFYISGVADSEKKIDGIHYNIKLTYQEVLSHVENSKCVFEVMQKGQVGCTLRTLEAICLKKKLLTNNQSLLQSKFAGSYIYYCDDFENISIDSVLNNKTSDEEYSRLQYIVSPVRFLEKILNVINERK